MNFSQYIQDNVEEGLSGVKGANSVKIIGPDLFKLEELATQVQRIMSDVRGITDLGIFRVLGQPNLNIESRPRKSRPLRIELRRRQYLRADGLRRQCRNHHLRGGPAIRRERPRRAEI